MENAQNIKDPIERYFHCFCQNLQEHLECSNFIHWPRWLQEDWRDLAVDLPIIMQLDQHWGKDTLHSFLDEIRNDFNKKREKQSNEISRHL